MRPAWATAAAGLAVILLAGCGSSESMSAGAEDASLPAPPLESRVIASGNVPSVRPSDLRVPILRYRSYVASNLDPMIADVREMLLAIRAGDLEAARSSWRRADSRYESIGASYGAFGELDARINGTASGLAEGTRSSDFTGLHRIELSLWKRDSTADAVAATRGLLSDVSRLRGRIGSVQIDPLEFSLRSHEVLEDSLHLQLSGRASPWSDSALLALRSNIRGTRFLLETIRSLVVRRDPVVWKSAEQALDQLDAALRDTEGAHRTLPDWSRLPQEARELIAGRTAAAAERLAYVPELIDPRPQLPARSAFGSGQVAG